MSGIYGIINLDGSQIDPKFPAAMHQAMAHWGPHGGNMWNEGSAGLGSLLLFNTPESIHENMPKKSNLGFVLTAEARLDNRRELCEELEINFLDAQDLPDGDLILRAYEIWGQDCTSHLLGDWSFAAWHPNEKKLFLARDHFGNTSLYYYADAHRFAFASDRKALFALGIPRRLNEFYLACVLISWTAHHGPQTIEVDLNRLPPAHTLTLVDHSILVNQYWRLEDVREMRLKNSDDYVEGFLEVYDRAVRDRLRSHSSTGVTLSGGLDSGSITALMARVLKEHDQRLTAYTSIPLYDVSNTVGSQGFGDELPFAKATANFAGNVDLFEIQARNLTPIQSMLHGLHVHGEPGHAAGNMYWIQELMATAQKDGIRTLMTGQGGNATVSWTGKSTRDIFRGYTKRRKWKSIIRYGLFSITPTSLRPTLNGLIHRIINIDHKWQASAIHPDLVKCLNLSDQYNQNAGKISNVEDWQPASMHRYAIIKPGESFLGSNWAENGAAYGMEVRDATFDKRVMEFTLSVPDREYIGPQGEDRWLIRQAMQGLLPDEVRLNRRRGRQAADLGQRLLNSPAEMEAALSQVESCHLAHQYLAVERMRNVWNALQKDVNVQNTHLAVTILTRGLMAGLYLSNLEKEG